MNPKVVNPHKKIWKFSQSQKWKSVSIYLTLDLSKNLKKISKREPKFRRSKNNSYLKILNLKEFKIFMGLLFAATTRVESGINLWRISRRSSKHYFNEASNFGRFMSLARFQKIRKFLSKCFVDPTVTENDPWWHIIGGVNQFNNIRKCTFTRVPVLVLDESMCTWRPRTTKRGGLPHLTYETRKPESLGTEFKTTACGTTGCLLSLEIMRGCESMEKQLFNKTYGHCTGLVLCMTERTENYEFTHSWKIHDNLEIEFENENHRDDWMVQCEISDK